MIRATCINAAPELIGKTVQLRTHENPDRVWVQFDDIDLEHDGVRLGVGWHEFHKDAFEIGVNDMIRSCLHECVVEPMKGFFHDLDWDACNPYVAGKFATGGTVTLTEQPVLGETVSEQTIPKDSDLYRRMIADEFGLKPKVDPVRMIIEPMGRGPDCKHLVFTTPEMDEVSIPLTWAKLLETRRNLVNDGAVPLSPNPLVTQANSLFGAYPVTVGMDISNRPDMTSVVITGGRREGKQTFMGLKVLTDPWMTETVEDWSDCRSPSRARRRLKRGFPQHVKYREVPLTNVVVHGDIVIMHPETYRALRLEAGRNRHMDTFEIKQVLT